MILESCPVPCLHSTVWPASIALFFYVVVFLFASYASWWHRQSAEQTKAPFARGIYIGRLLTRLLIPACSRISRRRNLLHLASLPEYVGKSSENPCVTSPANLPRVSATYAIQGEGRGGGVHAPGRPEAAAEPPQEGEGGSEGGERVSRVTARRLVELLE